MTAKNPPVFLQSEAHPAQDVRRFFYHLMAQRQGVINPGDLVVSENGTPNMSVEVAGGAAIIHGTESTYQGSYFVENRGTWPLSIAASDPTNDRFDLVVAQVEDSEESGATDAWSLAVVTGTPAGSPVVPTAPENCIVLAYVFVQATVTTILDSNITDQRLDSTFGPGTQDGFAATTGGVIVCTSSTRPTDTYAGMEIYETDTGDVRIWNGSDWALTAWTESDGRYAAAAYDSSNQSIPDAATTAVQFDSIVNGGGASGFTVSGNEIVVPTGGEGLYYCRASAYWAGNATGQRTSYIVKNASLTSGYHGGRIQNSVHVSNTSGPVVEVSGLVPLSAGDSVGQFVFQNSGGALNVQNTNRLTMVSIVRVGR